MKKRVVSLLAMLIALAFATTGVVSAANVSATVMSTACPSTAAAQCTSAATSAFCNPRSFPCPIIKTDDSSMPAVVSCVAVTKCCQYKPVVVKAALMTPAMSAPAWVPQQAEKIVQAYENQPRTVGNKADQSTPGTQNGSVIVVDTGKVDNSTQNRQQNDTASNNAHNSANTVDIGNANAAATDVNSTPANVKIAEVDGTGTATNVNSGTNVSAPPTSTPQS